MREAIKAIGESVLLAAFAICIGVLVAWEFLKEARHG